MTADNPNTLRTCIGCRRTTAASDLLRLVLTADGGLSLGNRGGRAGRGASIHRNDACVRKAIAARSFARAFRGRSPQADGPELAALILDGSQVQHQRPYPLQEMNRTP
jgi:hypothetical protein